MAAKKEDREFIDRSKDYKSDRHADEDNSEDEDSSYGPYASFDQSGLIFLISLLCNNCMYVCFLDKGIESLPPQEASQILL